MHDLYQDFCRKRLLSVFAMQKNHQNQNGVWPYASSLTCVMLIMVITQATLAFAAPLVTDIPAQSFNIPSGDLTRALSLYAANAGVLLPFDSALTDGKVTQGLKGKYTLGDGFSQLLKGSGLEVINNEKGNLELKKAPKLKADDDSKNLPVDISLKEIVVRSKRFYEIGPLPGLGLTKEQIPGNVQSISAKEIQESHALSLTDLMNKKLQSVNVNDYQGNPFQMDVTYRGFTAGPQIGTPQGLSVFFDGIRVNEPFGDVVNWDMIPMNALAGVDVFPGSNPIFGLNTLGGAFTVKTKDGFNHEGVNAEVLTGSYGRKQLQVTGGWNNGTVALFGAGNFFLEDGWRENSPSRVNQLFGKGSYRGEKLDLNLSTLLVQTDLVGNGLLPSEMYKQNRDGSFTSEDTTKNKLQQFQLSGSYFVSDTFTITGQVYRRDSQRKQKGADVYTEFGDKQKNRNLKPGEEFTCVYNSTGQAAKYGLPNYYVLNLAIPVIDPNGEFSNEFLIDYYQNKGGAGAPDYDKLNGYLVDPLTGDPNPLAATLQPVSASFNQELPAEVVAVFTHNFRIHQNFDVTNYTTVQADRLDIETNRTTPDGDVLYKFSGFDFPQVFPGTSNPNSNINPDAKIAYYYDVDAQGNAIQDSNGNYVKHAVVFLKPDNAENCLTTQFSSATGSSNRGILTELDPVTNQPVTVDGLYQNSGTAGGVVEGTPTAIINDGLINQITDGASVQFNWNLPKHKFMVGASIDSSHAEYANEQKLGILDATRKASLNPDLIRDEYAAATIGVRNNDFSGNNITKSIYASETWSPIETLHITSAMRYNATKANIELASRRLGDQFNDISNFYATPDYYNLAINGVRPVTGYKIPELASVLGAAEKEKHSYYSLNPSLGVSWQAKENLNVFGNVAQGTRTPSVIELGCAFDHTLVDVGPRFEGTVEVGRNYVEKSLAENRSCQLPNTLSGDPHLPQIKATTYDFGVRGTFASLFGAENIVWNLGAYRTDLKDDIYLITFPGNQNFFDTIGNTRRQGIEAGISASFGKTNLRLNYALTDATFQSTFDMAADDNSSAIRTSQYCNNTGTCIYSDPEDEVGRIRVKPGNRMPGVPLHNLNATLSYELTPKWQVGITAIAHSGSFLRGNENNEHEQGKSVMVTVPVYDANGAATGAYQQVSRQPSTNPGKLDGYATFNFQTSYRLTDEWTATLLVNNLLDKEYFSAGRLGRNPFSPSINGAIGPDGYNHNSGDWLSTNFIAPAAPRGLWISLRYEFSPDKK